MKKFILLIMVLLFTMNSFCQVEKAPSLSKAYYLQKSKSNNTTGWILLGAGTAMIVGGAMTYPPRKPSHGIEGVGLTLNANDIIIMIGASADIISIPFFISAHKNEKRAGRVAITNQKILWYQKNNIGFVTQPSVTIRIR